MWILYVVAFIQASLGTFFSPAKSAYLPRLRSFKEPDLGSLALPPEHGRLAELTRRLTMQKGQVSFHHCRTIHGSDINRARTPRLSLAVHLQDGANRWRKFLNPHGVAWEIVSDRMAARLPDDTPDYTDPAVFPVLWSQD